MLWLTGRKGLSGSAERTLVTATAPRSHLLNPGRRGSMQTWALRRKGCRLEEAAQKRRNYHAGPGVGAAAGSGPVPGTPRERLRAWTEARTSQVTRGSRVGARVGVWGGWGKSPRGSLKVSTTLCQPRTTMNRGDTCLRTLACCLHLRIGPLGGVEIIILQGLGLSVFALSDKPSPIIYSFSAALYAYEEPKSSQKSLKIPDTPR